MTNELISLDNKAIQRLLQIDINENLFIENVPVLFSQNKTIEERLSEPIKNAHFYKINELSFEEQFPARDAFENVIASLNNSAFNFVYFLSGDSKGVSIYLGIVDNYKKIDKERVLNSFDIAQSFINSFRGNFLGSKVEQLKSSQKENLQENSFYSEIISKIVKSKRKSFLHGIPSTNEEKPGEKSVYQGIDRLINSMRGETYQYMLVCEQLDNKIIEATLDKVYDYYNRISKLAEKDVSANQTEGTNESTNEGSSTSRGKNTSVSENKGKSSSENDSYSSKGTNSGTGTSKGSNESFTTNTGKTIGKNSSFGKTFNVKVVEKEFKEQLQYLDEEYIPRLKFGKSKGLFKTAIYAMSENNATLEKLEANIKSIFQGETSTFVPLHEVHLFDVNVENDAVIKRNSELLSHFQIFNTKALANHESYLMQNIELNNGTAELATYLTANEISLIGGMPLTEIPGIKLNEAVDFGLNVPYEKDGFELGVIIQRGIALKENKVKLDKKILNKHIFISGVTGSGKTTTSQKILLESNLPFLVIEPAKTEYRQLYDKDNSIQFFTAGRNDLSPLLINPMELVKGENISSHVDMLMATFQATYPMEASMPYILKEAVLNCYEKLGWDIDSNENIYTEDAWNENGEYWPTFSNLVNELKEVVNSKGFGKELKDNYIGSLISRFSDLTIGTRGSIFNVPLSIDFENLIDSKVVIELDELKNEEDKILIMGFVFTRLIEIIKRRHKMNPAFSHITLIEEAHRLLSKADPSERSKKIAVQTFTDMLAEIRKYGESLIIVDQIPNKLTPEVLKNTNTKIVHKIFADDDKTAIAHSIALDDKQKQFLSKLGVGETIVFTEGWHKPVWIKISAKSNVNPVEVTEDIISKQGDKIIKLQINRFFPSFSEYKLSNEQILFLIKYKKRHVKNLAKLIKTKVDNEEIENISKIINAFARYFSPDQKLFNAIAEEIWGMVKTYYYQSNLKEQKEKFKKYVSRYFIMRNNKEAIKYEDNNEEYNLIDKIKDKIN